MDVTVHGREWSEFCLLCMRSHCTNMWHSCREYEWIQDLKHIGDVFFEALELGRVLFERCNLIQGHISCFCELRCLLGFLTQLPLKLRTALVGLAELLPRLCLLLLVVLCHALPMFHLYSPRA